jgi:hypothetical protein
MSSLPRLPIGAVECSGLLLIRIATASPYQFVSTYFTILLFRTHLIRAINVEVGKGGMGESHRRRGQGSEKHRLSLHID